MDICDKVEALRFARETTPAIAAVPSAPQRKYESAVENLKDAKRHEFPIQPAQKKKSPK